MAKAFHGDQELKILEFADFLVIPRICIIFVCLFASHAKTINPELSFLQGVVTEHPPLLLDPPAGGEDEEIVEDASLQHPNLHQLRHMNPERMLGQLTLFFIAFIFHSYHISLIVYVTYIIFHYILHILRSFNYNDCNRERVAFKAIFLDVQFIQS